MARGAVIAATVLSIALGGGLAVFAARRRRRSGCATVVGVKALAAAATARSNAVTSVSLAGVSLLSVPLADLSCLRNLVRLDLSGCGLTELQAGISSLQGLQVLLAPRNKLSSLPAELAGLAGSLVQLDLGSNQLEQVPPSLCALTKLTLLNLMGNRLQRLPEEFGQLTALRLIGLKSNKLVELPASFSKLTSLVELFITDNQLTDLPPGMSACTSLVKLQASFNAFTALPACLLHLFRLELLRVAVCAIQELPTGLLESGAMPRLAWFSVAGNPACPDPPPPAPGLPLVAREELELGQKLGDGASGDVFRAVWRGELVAVKFFRADVSPDGRTEDEVALAIALQHPHLTQVLGRVEHPSGLVLRLESGKPLAHKPTSAHLLRCKWADETRFPLPRALALAARVADALRYCHAAGVCHGDVYAHNVLMDEDGSVTLCDFGASYSYDRTRQPFWEAMEVRAYGLLLRDVVARCDPPASAAAGAAAAVVDGLRALAERCVELAPAQRPTFEAVCGQLAALGAQLGKDA
ncbi:hypothetical protein HYH03_000424 [Edaphochlamys debaryana]|uniref:Protein kinase domain-containing protein n=1 Tax=Edaphochlamys debaryana TaxID=47281 RepID=A0A836C659_9CHLO|nr:hypothetical protein HYH03_000424 [Edaphochlamys debaryana]|eukprot:KAG2501926.1 hypothetical protein HYH03_000424 [Edaphochlamys debaryana]